MHEAWLFRVYAEVNFRSGMPPMGMGPRGAWTGASGGGGGSAPLNYSGGSPGAYGAPPGSNGPPGPPTPIMPSPQDSSNSGELR